MKALNAPSWLTERPIAHRGLHDAASGVIENTLQAAEAAIAGGFAIECDIRISADGEVFVFHDDTLDRLTDATGAPDRDERRGDPEVRASCRPAPRAPPPPLRGRAGAGGRAELGSRNPPWRRKQRFRRRRPGRKTPFDRRLARPPTLTRPRKGGGDRHRHALHPDLRRVSRGRRRPHADHLRAQEPVRRRLAHRRPRRRARLRLRGPAGAQELRPRPRGLLTATPPRSRPPGAPARSASWLSCPMTIPPGMS